MPGEESHSLPLSLSLSSPPMRVTPQFFLTALLCCRTTERFSLDIDMAYCTFPVLITVHLLGASPHGMASLQEQHGRRCYWDGFYGTVRFVGEIPPSKGEGRQLARERAVQITSRCLLLCLLRQGCGLELSGMTPHVGNTTGSMREYGTSLAGALPGHSLTVWLFGYVCNGLLSPAIPTVAHL